MSKSAAVAFVLLFLVAVAFVVVSAVSLLKWNGHGGRDSVSRVRECARSVRRGCCRGATGAAGEDGDPGPTGASAEGPQAQIAYAAGINPGFIIGGSDPSLALAIAFGGAGAFDLMIAPIDPVAQSDTVRVLNSFGWSPVRSGTLSDLQIVFPPGEISQTGMSMFAQIWQRPACNGPWTGTAMLASHLFDTDGSAFCMADNTHTLPFGAGDRISLVFYVDTGSWGPTPSQITDGISAGLGYSFL